MVPRPGFEPRSLPREGNMLDRTTLPGRMRTGHRSRIKSWSSRVRLDSAHGRINSEPACCCMARARKSIKQRFLPGARMRSVMEEFRRMTNDCIRIGLEFEKENKVTPAMKKLSFLCYGELRIRYGGYSGYTLCAISKAAGILAARRKSMRRGFPTSTPYLSRGVLVSCYGFRVEDGMLLVHLDAERFERIQLNSHTRLLLEDVDLRVRSFTLTDGSLSLCVSKEIKEIDERELLGTLGVDRNLRNLAVGNAQRVTYYDVTKAVEIADNSNCIIRSFKRPDVRIRRKSKRTIE